jgi:hypothetical protein
MMMKCMSLSDVDVISKMIQTQCRGYLRTELRSVHEIQTDDVGEMDLGWRRMTGNIKGREHVWDGVKLGKIIQIYNMIVDCENEKWIKLAQDLSSTSIANRTEVGRKKGRGSKTIPSHSNFAAVRRTPWKSTLHFAHEHSHSTWLADKHMHE